MTRAGQLDGRLHGFAGPNLADQDDIRRLAQGAFQRPPIVLGIQPELALADDALPVRMHELDRIFDGDDVARRRAVAMTDHRGECRRLPGARRADHEDDPPLVHHQMAQHRG